MQTRNRFRPLCLLLLLAIGITACSIGLNNTVSAITAENAPYDVTVRFYCHGGDGAEPELEVTLRRDGDPSALLLGENCMRQEIDYILPPALRGEIPGGGEGERLLAALYRQDRLHLTELAVARIHFDA